MQKYNSSKEMKKRFDYLLKRDFTGSSVGQVKRALEGTLGPLPEINWPMPNDNSWAVIRARDIDANVEDITKPSTFSFPPAIETNRGRANLINHPVFYGTFDARTAMHEIKVDLGTECYVSIWEFTKNTPVLTTFLSNIDEKNEFQAISKLIPSGLPKGLTGGYTEKSLDTGLRLRADAFLNENYELTAKIAHDIIYNNKAKSNGILYPSIVDPYRGNIALNPSFVTENMNCILVYKMIWTGAFIFQVLSRGINNNGNIEWANAGEYEFDEVDHKYRGSNSPDNIHPSALNIL